jgi:hypothetical protein
MNLYLKKLRNTDDLEKEKQRLLKHRKRLEAEGILSLQNLTGFGGDQASGKKNEKSSGGDASDLLSLATPLIGLVTDIVGNRLAGDGIANGKGSFAKKMLMRAMGAGGSVLKGPIKELVGGYLKWKAIELSYKGVKLVVQHKKKKKKVREEQNSQ